VRFGRYIFDLLFEDRHGAKLIVEIQKGTLDRNHTYKVLDYYDEYKERHPGEFIDVMLVANVIPVERKKRLNAWGVSYKEIAESEFSANSPAPEIAASNVAQKPASHQSEGGQMVRANEFSFPLEQGDLDLMRAYSGNQGRKSYFGFAGNRGAISVLYSRPEGATQREVNEVAAKLEMRQRNFRNMVREEAKQWGHRAYKWKDKSRGGMVYKLIYNRDHRGPGDCDDPPPDWEERNGYVAPPDAIVQKWY